MILEDPQPQRSYPDRQNLFTQHLAYAALDYNREKFATSKSEAFSSEKSSTTSVLCCYSILSL